MTEHTYRCSNQLCKNQTFRLFTPDEGEHIVVRCARCGSLALVGPPRGAVHAELIDYVPTPNPCGDCDL